MKQVMVMEAAFSWVAAPKAMVALVAARPASAARRVGCINAECPVRACVNSLVVEIWLSGIPTRASLTCAHEICDSHITIDYGRDADAAVRHTFARRGHRGLLCRSA